MGKKKQKNNGLGKALYRDRFGQQQGRNKDSFLHTSELNDGIEHAQALQSVTEQNPYEDYLACAELEGRDFTAIRTNVKTADTSLAGYTPARDFTEDAALELSKAQLSQMQYAEQKLNIEILDPTNAGLLSQAEEDAIKVKQDDNREFLSVPRRPKWDADTTAEELVQKERENFLEWRRKLVRLEEVEGLLMTPFERNLEFWRQMWRVLERSDVVVQIVDARNPLLFYCKDVDIYVKELDENKVPVILINKADYLTQEQRQYWVDLLESQGQRVIFWSATLETEKNEAAEKAAKEREERERELLKNPIIETDDEYTDDDEETDSDNEEDAAVAETSKEEESAVAETSKTEESAVAETSKEEDPAVAEASKALASVAIDDSSDTKNAENATGGRNSADILNGDELIELLTSLHTGKKCREGITTIGLVGYPNVGKSSTINALLQTKKVSVSATPGKTKHFQTIFLEPTVMLCDCPGLVMPTFVSTKADMVICGILPVDQMRDYVPPVTLVCRHIPRRLLELTYGFVLPKPNEADGEDPNKPPTAHQLLEAYALMRGYMTHKNVPDYQRSARVILKDYVNGKLLYCHPPPNVSAEEFRPTRELPQVVKVKAKESRTAPKGKTIKTFKCSIDNEFFKKREPGYMVTKRVGISEHLTPADMPEGKPWKKKMKGKREKGRRQHRELDLH